MLLLWWWWWWVSGALGVRSKDISEHASIHQSKHTSTTHPRTISIATSVSRCRRCLSRAPRLGPLLLQQRAKVEGRHAAAGRMNEEHGSCVA